MTIVCVWFLYVLCIINPWRYAEKRFFILFLVIFWLLNSIQVFCVLLRFHFFLFCVCCDLLFGCYGKRVITDCLSQFWTVLWPQCNFNCIAAHSNIFVIIKFKIIMWLASGFPYLSWKKNIAGGPARWVWSLCGSGDMPNSICIYLWY